MLLLMGLVAMGVGQLVNPLPLGYLVAFGYTVMGVLEAQELVPAGVDESEVSEESGRDGSPAEERREDPDRASS